MNASSAPFPPGTFHPQQSNPSAKERPEIEDNAYVSAEAQMMSAEDALVDNVKTVDPFLGATRLGYASATGVLPSEAATEPRMFGDAGERAPWCMRHYERNPGGVSAWGKCVHSSARLYALSS